MMMPMVDSDTVNLSVQDFASDPRGARAGGESAYPTVYGRRAPKQEGALTHKKPPRRTIRYLI
jgi:hypothetical protein